MNGNRYFKVNWEQGSCIQIVFNAGKLKKGRPHCLGVHHLAISSFRGTYHHYIGKKYVHTNLLMTTENQFNKALDEMFNLLKK